MEKKKAKSWIVPVSFTETVSNWPTKAGNHVPYKNESILCECMRCVPVVQRLPASCQGTPTLGTSVKCRCQKKAFTLQQNQWEEGTACCNHRGVLLEVKKYGTPSSETFSQTAAFLPERRLEFFHFSVSPKAWSRAEVDIHQETAFPLQISTKISCYCNKPLDSAAPLHRLF